MQRTATLLTLAGALPFLGLTVCLALGVGGNGVMFALLAYAAVVLSFLGGIQWGIALRHPGDARLSVWILSIAVVPSLIGWVALVSTSRAGLYIAAAGITAACLIDRALYHMEMLPGWYLRLRVGITLAVVACLMLAAIFG